MAHPATQHAGHVVQVIGPVVDVQFAEHELPEIHDAVKITSDSAKGLPPGQAGDALISIVAEVAQHLGEGRVRTVAMTPTEGVVRGMKVEALGGPISVPVGRATLG